MRQTTKTLAALALVGLAGCTSGNSGIEPPFTSVNLNSNKVQLNVGVATYYNAAGTATTGLNVVATFRQPNGLSATLLNTPTITGPFTVPAATSAGTDAGTHHLSGSPQALPGTTAVATTFGQNGGLYAYGFAPENSTTSGAVSYKKYALPFFDAFDIGAVKFIGGPPAYPNTQISSFPSGFQGYPMGFTIFGGGLLPTAGSYGLSVNIPSANNAGATLVANPATLTNTAGLAAFAAPPVFTSSTAGGGTVTCVAPAGTTETLVELREETAGLFYTQVVQGGGAISAIFADNLGPVASSGTIAPTVAKGDTYDVQCIGVDYPAFEAGPPANVQQVPSLGSGQSDISISQGITGTY